MTAITAIGLARQTALAYGLGVITKLKTIAALGVMLCAILGCASGPLNSRDSNLYVVTIEFFPEFGKTNQTIEIITPPGVPFAVQTQDDAGNHYQISGTLRLLSEHPPIRLFFSQGGSVSGSAQPRNQVLAEFKKPGADRTAYGMAEEADASPCAIRQDIQLHRELVKLGTNNAASMEIITRSDGPHHKK